MRASNTELMSTILGANNIEMSILRANNICLIGFGSDSYVGVRAFGCKRADRNEMGGCGNFGSARKSCVFMPDIGIVSLSACMAAPPCGV